MDGLSRAKARFSTFTQEEADRICGAHAGPRLAWPPNSTAPVGVHALCARAVGRSTSLVRRPLRAATARDCARFALWFALMDVPAAVSIEGPDLSLRALPDYAREQPGLMARLTGVLVESPPRFLLFCGEDEPEPVSDLVPAVDCTGEASGFFVDLMTVGHQVAARAKRPLVTLSPG